MGARTLTVTLTEPQARALRLAALDTLLDPARCDTVLGQSAVVSAGMYAVRKITSALAGEDLDA